MKLTVILLLTGLMGSARTNGQNVTLHFQNVSVQTVLKEIIKQTRFTLIYNEGDLKAAKPVTIHIENGTIGDALAACFKDQPFDFMISDRTIIVKTVSSRAGVSSATAVQLPPPLNVGGRVLNENDEPVAASVNIKGTTKGTATDSEGRFFLNDVEVSAILVFTSITAHTLEIPLGGRTELLVRMQSKEKDLEDLQITIQTGYQEKKVTEITGSVSRLGQKQLSGVSNHSLFQNLQGKVPGMNVMTNSGSPEGISSITIRGVGSLGGGGSPASPQSSTQPLIVVDGIIQETSSILNPLSFINPSDVENITVLKDAASSAIYGSRAANGVIVITTRGSKFQSGKHIQFSAVYGRNDISFGKFRMMNSQEQIEMARTAFRNTFLTLFNPNATQAQIDGFIASQGVPLTATSSTEWYKMPFRKGSTQDYNLSISGTDTRFKYYLSGGYYREQPTKLKTNYEQINFRGNSEYRLSDKLTLSSGVNLSSTKMRNGDYNALVDNPLNGTQSSDVFKFILPYDVPNNADGSLKQGIRGQEGWSSIIPNPMLGMQYNRTQNNGLFISADLKGSYKLTNWLQLVSSNRFSRKTSYYLNYQSPLDRSSTFFSQGGRVQEGNGTFTNWITSNVLSASITWKSHKIGGLLGQEFNQLSNSFFLSAATDLIPGGLQNITGGRKNLSVTKNASELAFLSFFALLDYSYANRLFFTASVRNDASSKFGEDHKRGTFFSLGGAWQLTGEHFLKKSKTLSNLKLRTSYGTTGNAEPVRAYAADGLYSIVAGGNGIITPYNGQYSLTPSLFENPDLHWEVQQIANLGLDLGLWNRVSVTADFYIKTNKDLLQLISLPGTSGITGGGITRNIGSIRNKGVELSIATLNVKNPFRWNTLITAAYNDNKVVSLKENKDIPSAVLQGNIIKVGEPLYAWYMPVFAGVNPQTGISQWEQLETNASGGLTGNKILVNSPALATRQLVGSPLPVWTGGLSNTFAYKGLSLDILFTFSLGNYILNVNRLDVDMDGYLPFLAHAALPEGKTRWTQPGDVADYPRLFAFQKVDNSYPTTRFLENGSYGRLKNVRLQYALPARWLASKTFKNIDVFISADNLATFTRYSGMDPEIAGFGFELANKYPLTKKVLFGVNVGL